MGRLGSVNLAPNGKTAVYSVSYYSKEQNKSHSVLYLLDMKSKAIQQLTTSEKSEGGATYINNGKHIAYLFGGQVWMMNADGSNRVQISHEKDGVIDFSLFT